MFAFFLDDFARVDAGRRLVLVEARARRAARSAVSAAVFAVRRTLLVAPRVEVTPVISAARAASWPIPSIAAAAVLPIAVAVVSIKSPPARAD